jgi:hypothetical protein
MRNEFVTEVAYVGNRIWQINHSRRLKLRNLNRVFVTGDKRIYSLNRFMNHEIRRTVSSGMLRRVALVRTDVSEELSASIRVTNRLTRSNASINLTSK